MAISDANGTVIEERHFSPWGKVDWFRVNGQEADFKDSILLRGFTGHEHFEGIALIHMNGRMYDPQLRRFLSPDNHIQDPYNTLSYDRFGYVWNNPLMNIDPSGELEIFTLIAIIVAFVGVAYVANAYFNRDLETGKWEWDISNWRVFGNTPHQMPLPPPYENNNNLESALANNGNFDLNQNNDNSQNREPCPTPILPENCEDAGYLPAGEGYENTDFGSMSSGSGDESVISSVSAGSGSNPDTEEEEENEEDEENGCETPLVCPQGQIFDTKSCSCKVECPTTSGYLHVDALGENIGPGANTLVKTDNFRDTAGAIIASINCESGKIYKNDQVNVLSNVAEIRDYIKADGTTSTANYYPVEYKNCDGNLPANEDYEPNKPCSDCDGGNPLQNMEIVGTVNNPDTGGDFGENVRGAGVHHKGADYGAPIGTDIFASNAGKIVKIVSDHPDDAKDNKVYQDDEGEFDWRKYIEKRKGEGKDVNDGGNRVMVEYTRNGITFTQNYMHMEQDSNNHLSVGDLVNVGDLIGTVGITGNAQAIPEANSHLHMQIVDTSKSSSGNLENKVDPNGHIYGNIDYDTGEDANPCTEN